MKDFDQEQDDHIINYEKKRKKFWYWYRQQIRRKIRLAAGILGKQLLEEIQGEIISTWSKTLPREKGEDLEYTIRKIEWAHFVICWYEEL